MYLSRVPTRVAAVLALAGAWAGTLAVRADEDAGKLADTAWDGVSATAVEIEQTGEMTVRRIVDGTPAPTGFPMPVPKSLSRIDPVHSICELTTAGADGKQVIVLRKGKAVAMKIGSGPWGPPGGPYAQMGAALANPFVCPKRTAGERREWRAAGADTVEGREATVLESVGDWPLAAAQAAAAAVPKAMREQAGGELKMTAYAIRLWVAKSDGRLLQQEKTVRQTLTRTDGESVEMTQRTLQVFRRFGITIDIPPEAQAALDAPAEGGEKE